ncbi:MAG: deoxyribodipyrimidine photo-lyase [Pseudomonadota bacterium]
MKKPPVIVWFRDDLRLDDHPALTAAVETGAPVLGVYILDDETPGEWRLGGAARWWLHLSLEKLETEFDKAGGVLVLKSGIAEEVIVDLAKTVDAQAVYWTRRYAPFEREQDAAAKSALADADIEAKSFPGKLLYEPWEILTKDEKPYRVFTPFWRALSGRGAPPAPLERLTAIVTPTRETLEKAQTEQLDDWELLPTKPDWAGGLRETWTPGELSALQRLGRFLAGGASDYAEARDIPSEDGTSRLSPHLRFGEISPRRIWVRTMEAVEAGDLKESQAEKFLQEVVWREFSWGLVYHNDDFLTEELQPKFRKFPWREDDETRKAWERGETGYPIVDAGMRQLYETGWMHNRVRMIVGSLLVKHLLLSWRDGQRWFWDTLVDADLGNNTAGWQWIGGCGADAAPYFRIFNPMTQGAKFDPEGAYVRRFVPELADLPAKHIHEPWSAPAGVLEAAGVKLGETYPRPIVEHKTGRERALQAFETVKGD